MDVNQIVELILEKPYYMRMGAENIANRLKVSSDEIREAKKIVQRRRLFSEVPPDKLNPHKVPKILILDIETAPIRAYVWRLWKQNIYLDQIISNWFMISWAAKWLLEDSIMSQVLTPDEIRKEDDQRIVETLWHILNQADIVVAHNGEKFDVPRIKARFLVHELPPTTFYQQIDTLKVAKREFSFPSNKLEALARACGIDGKDETDFNLWSSCMDGDNESLKRMELYNRQDVKVLEEVYLWMRPYIKSHPNYNLYIDSNKPVCPHCGGDHLEFVGYYYFTQTGKYKNYRCLDCGALSRERKTVFQNSKSILVSNGR